MGEKKEIVKYNNDLNYMPMPNFKGRQQDLFFAILSQIQEKHDSKNTLQRFFDPEKRKLVIPFKKFVEICRIDEWNRSFTEIWHEIRDFLNILTSYKIEYKTKRSYYNFVCFEEAEHDTWEQTINITFQKRFYDMVVSYKLGFTAFELAEFISLNSKYTKTLYRILKQFRSTGKAYFSWDEFLRIMDIPESYKNCDIDKQILKPTLKELTELTIFDQMRVPFKNLAYEKEKQKGTRGRGGKVIGITFTFKPENIDMQKLQHEVEQMQSEDDKYKTILANMADKFARFKYNGILHETAGFDFENFKIITNQFIENEFGDKEKRQHAYTARNKELFFKMIDTFKNNIV
ncbi:replication initiation protein [Campylobacter helveticus]|uniref:Replication initiation protein n=1 Tax=Campylobacter helveticus TaxID=28898 RepID=A0AAX2UG35_9BACT|nr:replication initiation protein [Campylobacter helveticus]TNB54926.1 replication initiation protein [Campylobacter helveticus]